MSEDRFSILFEKWVEKELYNYSNGKRRYLHFDPKINVDQKINFFKRFFSHSDKILQHSFHPFIKSDIISPRYKKVKGERNSKGKPLLRREDKIRPIAYSSHFDSLIYSWYSIMLTDRYCRLLKELKLEDCVLAYLAKDACNINFADQAFAEIKKRKQPVVMTFDISSFFDGIDHEILYKNWCKVLNVEKLPKDHFKIYKTLTAYTYVERKYLEEIFPLRFYRKKNDTSSRINRICSGIEFREYVGDLGLIEKNPFANKIVGSQRFGSVCGIPQGSTISACLSNIAMLDFDLKLNKLMGKLGGFYKRYSDDILIVCDNDNYISIKEVLEKEILNVELTINEEKTDIVFFKELNEKGLRGYDEHGNFKNLQYLGFEFNGTNIYIRSSTMAKQGRRLNSYLNRTLKSVNGKNSKNEIPFKKKLYKKFTEKGKQNFIKYASKAAVDIMKSKTIHQQYKNPISKIKKIIAKKQNEYIKPPL